MPSFPAMLCFDLNVNGATFISVARNDIDSGHISSKRHGECTPFIQFGNNEIFASARNLLISCDSATTEHSLCCSDTAAQRPALHLRREAQRSGVRCKRVLGRLLFYQKQELSIRFLNIAKPFICPSHTCHYITLIINFKNIKHFTITLNNFV